VVFITNNLHVCILANQGAFGKRGGVSSLPDISEGGYQKTPHDELEKLERLLAKESHEPQYFGQGQGQGSFIIYIYFFINLAMVMLYSDLDYIT